MLRIFQGPLWNKKNYKVVKFASHILVIYRCLILIYLNFLFECCNKIHLWLYDDASHLTIFLSKIGVSWLTCFIITLLLMLSLLCHGLIPKVVLFMEFVNFIIFISLFFILVIIFNSVVPMVSGSYPFYPSRWWDYSILVVSATIFVWSVQKRISAVASLRITTNKSK